MPQFPNFLPLAVPRTKTTASRNRDVLHSSVWLEQINCVPAWETHESGYGSLRRAEGEQNTNCALQHNLRSSWNPRLFWRDVRFICHGLIGILERMLAIMARRAFWFEKQMNKFWAPLAGVCAFSNWSRQIYNMYEPTGDLCSFHFALFLPAQQTKARGEGFHDGEQNFHC